MAQVGNGLLAGALGTAEAASASWFFSVAGAVVLFIIVVGVVVMAIVVRRWGRSAGVRSRHQDEIQRAAAADVAAMREDDKFFRPDGPGNQEDDL